MGLVSSIPGRRQAVPLVFLALAGCGGGAGPPAGGVVLITLDTTRADSIDCEEAPGRTPALCALSRDAIRFPHAYTPVPLTLPAHASLLTGLYPPRHGVRDNGWAALPEEARTLAEVAAEGGLATGAFVSCALLDRGLGLAQGFAVYDQPPLRRRSASDPYLERDGRETAEAFRAWLATLPPGRGFFAWVHVYDPHLPYEPPPPMLERAGGDPYLGEVADADQAVERVLAALDETGRDAVSWVVVTADHGEALGDHGEPSHGALCYESTLRVPLLIRPPRGWHGVPGPVRLVSLVDLYPTLLGFLDLAVPEGVDGLDLFASDPESQRALAARGVYVESLSGYFHYGWSPLVGWIDGRGKYLHSSRPEFFLPGDAEERVNRAPDRQRDCALSRERIVEVLARPTLDRPAAPGPRPELEAALTALGYAGVVFEGGDRMPSPLEPTDLPAPSERVGELSLLHRANALVDAERFADAHGLLDRILSENPAHRLALDLDALCSMHLGRFEEARALLERRLVLSPERADTHLNLALCLERQGDAVGAREHLRRALELAPQEPSVRSEAARLGVQIP